MQKRILNLKISFYIYYVSLSILVLDTLCLQVRSRLLLSLCGCFMSTSFPISAAAGFRFMDVTTDFGFKKLFGDEENADLTMSFLNDVLELNSSLVDLSFSNPAQLPETSDKRAGIFDFSGHDAKGNQYLIEMQKSQIAYIQDRLVYYATFPIADQAKKGGRRYYSSPSTEIMRIREAATVTYGKEEVELEEAPIIVPRSGWNYELKAIYCVAILGYDLEGSTTAVNCHSIRNDQPPHASFYDKLKFVTVELPLFDPGKPEYSLDRHLNKWLYFLKHSSDFDEIPEIFKNDKIFQKAFWVAELANLTPKERRLYDLNLKHSWDAYAVWETSHNKGLAKGLEEGLAKGLEEGLAKGLADALLLLLSQKLGLVPDDIQAALLTLNDPEQLRTLLTHLMEINDWETLRAQVAKSK